MKSQHDQVAKSTRARPPSYHLLRVRAVCPRFCSGAPESAHDLGPARCRQEPLRPSSNQKQRLLDRTERLLPTPGGPKIMSRFRCPAAKARTYGSNSAKLARRTAWEGRFGGLAILGLLNHRQRHARRL